MAERTGCPVLTDLWSYVSGNKYYGLYLFKFTVAVLRVAARISLSLETVGTVELAKGRDLTLSR
jgi:hypothetical protein